MKKSCNKCKALIEGTIYRCLLNFKLAYVEVSFEESCKVASVQAYGHSYRIIPAEECPKPTTGKQLHVLLKKINKLVLN